MTKGQKNNGRVTEEEFVKQALKNLRKPPYTGIHTRYSGFNEAFRKYFETDPVVATKRMVEQGIIATRPCKGGVMMYLPEDAPSATATVDAALAKILA